MAREPFNRIWTETPTVDDFREPTDAMWDAGWRGGAAAEPPEAFAQNWWQNRADFALRQLERNGAMDWLSDVPYEEWAFARGSDGTVYLAIQPNTAADPTSDDGSNWLSIPDYIRSLFNASGSATLFGVRAWANFDGTTSPPTIRGSGNISSITRVSFATYEVTFISPMQDSNYSVMGTTSQNDDGPGTLSDTLHAYNYTSSGFELKTNDDTSSQFPPVVENSIINISVVR